MGRYLIFFSYVGTSYRGMQIHNRKVGELLPAVKTVQGVLEIVMLVIPCCYLPDCLMESIEQWHLVILYRCLPDFLVEHMEQWHLDFPCHYLSYGKHGTFALSHSLIQHMEQRHLVILYHCLPDFLEECMECIKKLKPANEVITMTSSRTDSNVHALCNSVQIDLVHRNHPLEFDPKIITFCLNRILRKMNENIRILNTLRVTDDFSARRRVAERSYVYRLAVIKNLALLPGTPQTALECDRSHCVYPPFDLEKFLKAAEVLSGKNNFLSFTTTKASLDPLFNTSRPLKNMSIHIQRGSSYMEEHQDFVHSCIEFWEVHFQTRSFLYKQIRRMMGAMYAVAQGRLTLKDLQQFLDNPSLDNPGRIPALPAQGLFLKWVRYSKEDLHYEPPEISAVQEQVPDLAVEEE